MFLHLRVSCHREISKPYLPPKGVLTTIRGMGFMSAWTVNMVLNRALAMEKQSYDLYLWAQGRVTSLGAKVFLGELAGEELKHQAKLLNALKDRGRISDIGVNAQGVLDLKIVDRLRDVKLSEDADYQTILIFAGKREKETHDYYSEMAKKLGKSEVGQLFSRLAQEELKHKNLIEREYEKYILSQD